MEQRLGHPLYPDEERMVRENGLVIAVPRKVHQQSSPTYGGRNTRTRVEEDAADPHGAQRRDYESYEKAMNERGK